MAHSRQPLDDQELSAELAQTEGWSRVGDHIERTFKFDLYAHGLLFANAAGLAAEQMDHHPTITVGYQQVTVALSTHEPPGISRMDVEMAKRLDRAYKGI